ncbi:hypothetical protein SNK04_008207 [Fusarium graminearum]
MVPPVFGIRHLRPLASPSASAASRPVSTSTSVSASHTATALARADDPTLAVSKAHTVITTTATATTLHRYRHVGHPLHHGFSIRPFLPPPSPHRPLQTRGKRPPPPYSSPICPRV